MVRSSFHKVKSTIAATLLLSIGLFGCSGTPSVKTPPNTSGNPTTSTGVKPGGKVVYGAFQDPDTLDPQRTGLAAAVRVLEQVFDTLVSMKAGDPKIYPGLAESWEITPDGKEYTFKLKKGVKFHDGTPFNAEAVKYTFDRIIDPATKSLSALSAVGPYESSQVVDEFTVKLKFSKPYPPFLTSVANKTVGIISPTAAKKGAEEFARKPIGTGPFMIKEYIPKSHVTLVRNPDYNWGPPIYQHTGPAYLEEVKWQIVPEVGTRMATLDTGETQIIEYLVPEDVKRYQKDNRFKVLLIETPGAPRMNVLNVSKAPLDDVKVRQAINFATDRQTIVDTLFKGVYDVAYGPMEKPTFGYDASLDKMYPFDQTKAKQLLDDAGWKPGANNVRMKDGKPLELLFVVQSNDQWDEVAQMWQAQLAEVGIKVTLSSESSPTVFATYNKGTQHVSDFFFWSSDPVQLVAMFHSKSIASGFNWAHYSNAEVDKLLDQSTEEIDPTKRDALIKQIQQKVMADAPIVSIHTKKTVMALDAKLDGIGFSFVTYPVFYDLHYKQ
jgi:peptide/nickel transport system substrate-binding protein